MRTFRKPLTPGERDFRLGTLVGFSFWGGGGLGCMAILFGISAQQTVHNAQAAFSNPATRIEICIEVKPVREAVDKVKLVHPVLQVVSNSLQQLCPP